MTTIIVGNIFKNVKEVIFFLDIRLEVCYTINVK